MKPRATSSASVKIRKECEPIRLPGDSTGCLLLHGLTSSPYEMRYLVEFLHKKNFTVSVPLLPGHGQSPKALKNTDWLHWYEAAKTELFSLRKKCKSIIIIGQSMGAILALHLAAHYQVNGIVALSPAFILQNRLAKLSHILNSVYPFMKKSKGPDIKADTKNISYGKIPLKAISQLLDLCKHVKNDLPDIYIPALVIYAKHDHVVAPKGAIRIYDSISSNDKRILALDESFHILTLDVEKDIVSSEIHKFILSTHS